MLPSITKCYLIAKFDYDVFDEIAIFITNTGSILSCFSVGSRRITSKNGRNLLIGNYLELEFFDSKHKSLKKLKTAHLIRTLDLSIVNNELYKNLNRLFYKLDYNKEIDDKRLFDLYQEMLTLIMLSNNEYMIICYVFLKFFLIINPNLDKNLCERCLQNKNRMQSFDFSLKGFVCLDCINEPDTYFNDDEINLMYKIINSNFFNPVKHQMIDIENIAIKLLLKLNKYKSIHSKG